MKRILFVDDEPGILEELQLILRPQRDQWKMSFASGGDAALALMEIHPFDVIVSDMRMPGMHGAALLGRVRDKYPHVVRILLSGHTELSTALRVAPLAHQIVTKPCDAEMLGVAIERACLLTDILNDDAIRRIVGAHGDLPSLPRTYKDLAYALADPEVSLQKVARIVEQDAGLSARVLQLVNSAFFGIAHPMTNLQSAVSYVGMNTLKSLVLSVEVFRVFALKTVLPGFSLDEVQRHARITAHIAARLVVPQHLTDVSLAAGMLHDVGKLILAWKLPGQFREMLGEAEKEHCPLYKIEERRFGFSHAEVGAYLLHLWELPYTIVEAVAFHHGPNRVPHLDFDAVSAVYISNLLAHELAMPSSEAPLNNQIVIHYEELEEIRKLGVLENLADWRAMASEMSALLAEA